MATMGLLFYTVEEIAAEFKNIPGRQIRPTLQKMRDSLFGRYISGAF